MAKFRKSGSKGTPDLNMGSMSDIIFCILFFFMVITTMRESTLFVTVKPPMASEIQKMEKKSLVSNIYIGPPQQQLIRQYGSEPRIQLNDQIVDDVTAIREFIEQERAARAEADRPFMTTSIKADKDAKMGIITDVKSQLRNVGALRINYSTGRRVRSAE